jgi:hypothetical protein
MQTEQELEAYLVALLVRTIKENYGQPVPTVYN